MKGLLAIEWLKVKKFRSFWILIGFFVLLLPIWNYGITNGVLNLGAGDFNFLNQAYSFSYVWQNLGFWTSIFVIFLSVLVIIITTNEYQFRTNRQNVIDGWSRMQFYHAKWQMVLLLSLFTAAYVFLLGMVFAARSGSMSDFPGHIEYLFYTWVLALNYYAFALILSLFFKRSGITIGILFLYCLIIESIVSKYINHSFNTRIGNFLPLQCSDELLPFPILDLIKTMARMQETTSYTNYYLTASFIWMIIYYFIGRQKLLKSDW